MDYSYVKIEAEYCVPANVEARFRSLSLSAFWEAAAGKFKLSFSLRANGFELPETVEASREKPALAVVEEVRVSAQLWLVFDAEGIFSFSEVISSKGVALLVGSVC